MAKIEMPAIARWNSTITVREIGRANGLRTRRKGKANAQSTVIKKTLPAWQNQLKLRPAQALANPVGALISPGNRCGLDGAELPLFPAAEEMKGIELAGLRLIKHLPVIPAALVSRLAETPDQFGNRRYARNQPLVRHRSGTRTWSGRNPYGLAIQAGRTENEPGHTNAHENNKISHESNQPKEFRPKLLICWAHRLKSNNQTHYDNYINNYYTVTSVNTQRGSYTLTVLHTIHDDNGPTTTSISLEWIPHGQKKNS